MTKDEEWLLREKYMGLRDPYFEKDRARLAAGEPLAYVIGWQPFLGLEIHLDSTPLIPPYSAEAPQGTRPLIPRPETEWWTEELLAHVGRLTSYMDVRPPRSYMLDLCAGSGAIGCAALARLPEAQVYFGEIDPAHEETIWKNIRENGLDENPAFASLTHEASGEHSKASAGTRAHVRIGDLFEPFGGMRFDVIAANPPYIPEERELPESVAQYEPALALRAGADGLDLIRRIARELPRYLAPGGVAWIECDSAAAAAAAALFGPHNLSAKIRTDQYGTPRVLVVTLRQ